MSNEAETRSTLMFGQRAKTIKNEIQVNEELTAEEWKKRYQKEKEKNAHLRTKLAQFEIASGPTGDVSPDVIPKPSTSLSTVSTALSSTLTSYSSMPSLLSDQMLTSVCQECLRYQHDISKLCRQLDDKDDELGERSRDILALESQLTTQKKDIVTLNENNSLLVSEHREIEGKYISGQEEVRAIMAALEELSDSYQDKESELSLKSKQHDHSSVQITHLEEALQRTQEELARMKVRLAENRNKTVSMFLDLFNDFSHVTLSNKLQAAADLYKSSTSINQIPASECHSGSHSTSQSTSHATSQSTSRMVGSVSEHSSLCKSDDSGFTSPSSGMYHSLVSSRSTLDLSPPSPTRNIMSRSMCDLRPATDSDTTSSPNYQGSKVFQERVGDLRDRLSTLLESNYNRVVVPPDTNSSYVRNIRLKKLKPLGSGRVFTVFSRAARKQGKYGSADDIIARQIGRRE